MDASIIVGLSILVQFAAACFALWLIRITGRWVAWLAIAAALLLTALQRSISFAMAISGDTTHIHDLATEIVALSISILMLLGVAWITPLFLATKRLRDELTQSQQKLRESEEQFRAIYENTAIGLYRTTPDGKILLANPALVSMLGYWFFEELAERNLEAEGFEPDYPRSRFRELIERDDEIIGLESAWKRQDGSTVFVRESARAIRDAEGNTLHYEGTVEDITERKNAEEELKRHSGQLEEQARELRSLNRELETFSYSVAHDLRAPLRHIEGFALALLGDYGERLDDQGKRYVQKLRKSSVKMRQLIADLLKLSRVARAELSRSEVDLSQLARVIVSRMRESEPDRRVEFEVAENVTAVCDARLMGTALANLLGNAWKFTGKLPRARIEFGVKEVEGRQVYFVADDGAGFDMSGADKLFVPFRRLHDEGEFEGTGIGLATVQRIVRRHGGHIWAESEPGKGATFYFTLA